MATLKEKICRYNLYGKCNVFCNRIHVPNVPTKEQADVREYARRNQLCVSFMLFGKCGHKKDVFYEATHLPFRSVLLLTGNTTKQTNDNAALRALAKGQEKIIYTIGNMFRKLRKELKESSGIRPNSSKTTTVDKEEKKPDKTPLAFKPKFDNITQAYEVPNYPTGMVSIQKLGGISQLKVKTIDNNPSVLHYEAINPFENGGATLLDNQKKDDEIHTLMEYNVNGKRAINFMDNIMPKIEFDERNQGEIRLLLAKKERRILNLLPGKPDAFKFKYERMKRKIMEKAWKDEPTLDDIRNFVDYTVGAIGDSWQDVYESFRMEYIHHYFKHFKDNKADNRAVSKYLQDFKLNDTVENWFSHLHDTVCKSLFIHARTNHMIAMKHGNAN